MFQAIYIYDLRIKYGNLNAKNSYVKSKLFYYFILRVSLDRVQNFGYLQKKHKDKRLEY